MTPEELADIANQQLDNSLDERITKFLLDAPSRHVQRFLHRLHLENKQRYFQIARVALDIRISENADIMTRRIVCLTWSLLIFTVGLFLLTAGLFALTYCLVKHG